MLRLLFVGALFAIGLGAVFRSRFGALLFYLWFATFRPVEWVWVDLSPFRLSLVVGLLLVVPSLVSGVWPNMTHPLSAGALLMLALSLPPQLWAVRPDIGWEWIDYFARVILVALFATTLIDSRRRLLWALAIVAGSWAFHGGKAGVMAVIQGGAYYAEGLAGAFGDNNDYALGIVMAMPLMLAVAQGVDGTTWWGRGVKAAFYGAVPFSAVTVISTMSRGGALAMAVAIGAWLLLQRRGPLLVATGVVVVALLLPFVPMPQGYLERLSTISTETETLDASSRGRLHFWGLALRMAGDHPFGVGLKNYEANYDRYNEGPPEFGTSRAVHSSHFQVLAEVGYLGLLLWLMLFLYAGWRVWRIRRLVHEAGETLDADIARVYRAVTAGLAASMAGFLVGGSFLSMFLNDLTWLSFALVAALDRLARVELAGVGQPVVLAAAGPSSVPGRVVPAGR